MAIRADLGFGTEPVTVGDVTKDIDICEMASRIYDGLLRATDDLAFFDDTKFQASVANDVLESYGFPRIVSDMAAMRFSEQILQRAVSLKKEACDLTSTGEEAGSQDVLPVSP